MRIGALQTLWRPGRDPPKPAPPARRALLIAAPARPGGEGHTPAKGRKQESVARAKVERRVSQDCSRLDRAAKRKGGGVSARPQRDRRRLKVIFVPSSGRAPPPLQLRVRRAVPPRAPTGPPGGCALPARRPAGHRAPLPARSQPPRAPPRRRARLPLRGCCTRQTPPPGGEPALSPPRALRVHTVRAHAARWRSPCSASRLPWPPLFRSPALSPAAWWRRSALPCWWPRATPPLCWPRARPPPPGAPTPGAARVQAGHWRPPGIRRQAPPPRALAPRAPAARAPASAQVRPARPCPRAPPPPACAAAPDNEPRRGGQSPRFVPPLRSGGFARPLTAAPAAPAAPPARLRAPSPAAAPAPPRRPRF
eukprot:8900375-Pyramimonas_sp.AAC.1